MKIKPLLLLVILLLILIAGMPAIASTPTYKLGDTIEDFSFINQDGQENRLSDLLKEKDLVMINIWASWCPYCIHEFPYMQEAYEKYQDQVAIVSLNCEPSDSFDVIKAYQEEYCLTFEMGKDPIGFQQAMGASGIPLSFIVDRFGTICLILSGALPNADSFEQVFEAFIGDHYTDSVLYRGVPSTRPDVQPASNDALSAALDVSVNQSKTPIIWPMLPVEKDGRSVLASTNTGKSSSCSSVSASLNASAGDAIVVTFKTSIEACYDILRIDLNGNTVGVFSGDHDWTDYAIPVENDGEQIVNISYIKDHIGDHGEDTVWIDQITLTDDPQKALTENPLYPLASNEIYFDVMGDNAREIIFEDPQGILRANFGNARYIITNHDTASLQVKLTEEFFPESSSLYTSHGDFVPLVDCVNGEKYVLDVSVDAIETTNKLFTIVLFYPDSNLPDYYMLLLFKDEQQVQTLCEYNQLGNWKYLSESTVSEQRTLTLLPDQVQYIVACTDQNGFPVVGTMIQVCNENTCQVFVTDDQGQCSFSLPPHPWEIHILMLPSGYAVTSNEVAIAPLEGGKVSFTLIKE